MKRLFYKGIATLRASYSTQVAKELVENKAVISMALINDVLSAYHLRWPEPQTPFDTKPMIRGIEGMITARSKPLEQDLYQLLLNQFLMLNENLDRLIEGATTGDEAQKVLTAWRQANLNQLDMGNKIFIENTDQLRQIVSDLREAQDKIADSLTDLKQTGEILGKVTGVIDMIAQAVSLGTKLVALA